MYAIVSTGGKQYKVSPGMLLDVEQLPGEKGAAVRLDEVLAVRTDSDFKVGRPHLKGAAVKATIVGQVKGPKLINYRYRRREGYHRKVGHRQPMTRLKVEEITL